MRIQSKEFIIIRHFGSGRDIPRLSELEDTTCSTCEMTESVMMDSFMPHTRGQLSVVALQ